MFPVIETEEVVQKRKELESDIRRLRKSGIKDSAIISELSVLGWTTEKLACIFTSTDTFLAFCGLKRRHYGGNFWIR